MSRNPALFLVRRLALAQKSGLRLPRFNRSNFAHSFRDSRLVGVATRANSDRSRSTKGDSCCQLGLRDDANAVACFGSLAQASCCAKLGLEQCENWPKRNCYGKESAAAKGKAKAKGKRATNKLTLLAGGWLSSCIGLHSAGPAVALFTSIFRLRRRRLSRSTAIAITIGSGRFVRLVIAKYWIWL